ncbi:pyruvate dehydrogenase (acetyl-transferring), homodimeric type, partial [Nocardia sp. NPDC059091]
SHIVKDGLNRMYGPDDGRDPNVLYYLTMYNEPMVQPAEPEDLDVDGLLRGMYLLKKGPDNGGPKVQLMASGVGVPWALEAQELLEKDWGVPDQIRQYVPNHFTSLGTDGYAISDTRPAARRYYLVDGPSMATQALISLADTGVIPIDKAAEAAKKYQLDDPRAGASGSTEGAGA